MQFLILILKKYSTIITKKIDMTLIGWSQLAFGTIGVQNKNH